VPLDAPGGRRERTRKEGEQRRLPRAVRAHQGDALAAPELEVRRLEGDVRAEAPPGAAGGEQRLVAVHGAA
jgi:hypothetical protein